MPNALQSRIIKTGPVRWRELRFLQEDSFKEFTPEAEQKLKASLLKNDFVQTFNVWEDGDGVTWCLDGRHRVRVLEIVEREGTVVPDELPGSYLACANRQEAAKLTLVYSSAYARATQQGVADFLDYNNLNLADFVGEIDLPNIDLTELLAPSLELPAEEQEFEPNPPVVPISVLGDVYEFKSESRSLVHRLVCGSSTEADVVAVLLQGKPVRLVMTDPPYNVKYRGKTKDALRIENDDMDDASFRAFLYDFYTLAYAHMAPGAPIYVFHADSEGANFRSAFSEAGLKLSQCLVWVKQQFVMGRQDFHWQHEPILYGWKEGAAHPWYSDRKQTTVLRFDRPTRNADHPTMKPLDILEYLLECSSKQDEVVYDGFGGSGSLLLACEKTQRSAHVIELDPRYVDVHVRRYAKFMQDNQRRFTITRNGEALTEQQLAAYYPTSVAITVGEEKADICDDPSPT